ncbi:hypothetical protein [Niveibacterium sp. COAC-50]|uniref:hypothetical protein n=1 Tax=Niveibacterium sp. COAC-50 TaxID=2729384 RepID=UPI001554DCF6|nr:hypothetical protein [Niveibacterium sp. COAC-50]
MTTPSSQWCLVGNIKETRPFGPGGKEHKPGTQHFSSGTKVYCLPAQWGDGYEKVKVVGKHRGSSRMVKMVVCSAWITNWRAQVVYSSSILKLLTEEVLNWKSKEEVLEYLGSILSTAEGSSNV